jgi:hypothetical protein
MAKKSLTELTSNSPQQSNTAVDDSDGMFKNVGNGKVQVNVDKLRKYNIFFATPCYGGMLTDQFFLSMFRITQELIHMKINFRITTLRNESLIPRARNILTAMFLESDCSHLMFIDADIEFDPESIIRMLAVSSYPDHGLICGAYPKKTLPVDYAINLKFLNPDNGQVNMQNGVVEVLDASTGFMMIRRDVVQKLMEAYPELHYKNDSSIDPKFNRYCYSLFDTMHDPDDNRYLSEDYTFCRRWQKIGGKIWIDPNTRLNHVGSYTFQGDVGKIFSAQPSQS